MSTLSFSLTVAESLYHSDEQFPVDFNLAWVWLEYSRKDNAKSNFLKNGFQENLDFQLLKSQELRPQGGYSNKEQIRLTVDCFKHWAMMSGTEMGKEVRKYFIHCEQALKEKARTAGLPMPTEPELDAAKAIAEVLQTLGDISPRYAQRLADARIIRLERQLGLTALPPCGSQLLGAVEIAEDLGYKPESNHWSSLGRCVAKAHREAGLGEPTKEKRPCNGRMTSMMVYPSDDPIVREAIHQFYRLKLKSA